MQYPNAMRLPPRERAVLAALVVLALCMRGYLAWVGQWSTDPDRGIVNLMALHMAEGRAWPVFYYGQAYMGSLEPFLSSLFVRLLGPSGFAVGLGTAVPAALLVIPVYFLARRIAGPLAATLAAAFLVIGPDPFAAYMSSPRGGYALVLLFNTVILLLGARMADRAWRREPLPASDWIWIGLLGGLGWWIGPMVLSALGAAGLVVLVALRGRFWIPGVAWAAGAFVAGAAPWWLWNAQNGWLSLSMFKSVGGASPLFGALQLARRMYGVLGFPAPAWPLPAFGALLLLLGAAVLVAGLWLIRRQPRPAAPWAFAVVLLFAALFAAAYSTSSFSRTETLRYLLPLYPALAILFGVACAAAGARHRFAAALVAIPLLTPHVIARLDDHRPDPRRADVEAATQLSRELTRRSVDALFAPYRHHWINFVNRGALPVVEPTGDCVPFNDHAGLLARRPAFLASRELEHFVLSTRSSATQWILPGGKFAVDLRPAPETVRPLPRDAVASIDAAPEHPGSDAMDGNAATSWRADSLHGDPPPTLHIRLRQPVQIAGVRLFCRSARAPLFLALEGRAAEHEPWRMLAGPRPVTSYYWSGPGLYARDLYFTPELRCPPAAVTELRLTCRATERQPVHRFYISDLLLLEAVASAAPAPAPDVDAVIQACRARGVRRVYAHRWLADRIGVRALPDLTTDFSARLRRTASSVRGRPASLFTTLTNLHQAAFFCEPGFAPHNRALLEHDGHTVETEPLPGGDLLVVTRAAETPPLLWTGSVLLRDHP
jgi:hypothetical protein